MTQNETANALAKPFTADEYEWRVQSETRDGAKVHVLCYVTNRAIQQRLDDVFGPFGWQVDYAEGPAGGVMCTISAWDEKAKQWVRKADGADKSEIEAIKGGYSNASKRAACVWGIGRLLYRVPSAWVSLQERGKNYHKKAKGELKHWDDPQLPAWAVSGPGGKAAPSHESEEEEPETQTDPTARTLRAEFDASLKIRCGECKVKITTKAVRNRVVEQLCGLPKVQEIILANDSQYETPIPNMAFNSTGWLVLEQLLSSLDLRPYVAKAAKKASQQE